MCIECLFSKFDVLISKLEHVANSDFWGMVAVMIRWAAAVMVTLQWRRQGIKLRQERERERERGKGGVGKGVGGD